MIFQVEKNSVNMSEERYLCCLTNESIRGWSKIVITTDIEKTLKEANACEWVPTNWMIKFAKMMVYPEIEKEKLYKVLKQIPRGICNDFIHEEYNVVWLYFDLMAGSFLDEQFKKDYDEEDPSEIEFYSLYHPQRK